MLLDLMTVIKQADKQKKDRRVSGNILEWEYMNVLTAKQNMKQEYLIIVM